MYFRRCPRTAGVVLYHGHDNRSEHKSYSRYSRNSEPGDNQYFQSEKNGTYEKNEYLFCSCQPCNMVTPEKYCKADDSCYAGQSETWNLEFYVEAQNATEKEECAEELYPASYSFCPRDFYGCWCLAAKTGGLKKIIERFYRTFREKGRTLSIPDHYASCIYIR